MPKVGLEAGCAGALQPPLGLRHTHMLRAVPPFVLCASLQLLRVGSARPTQPQKSKHPTQGCFDFGAEGGT